MAVDPEELAAALEELRLEHGNETKEAAADRIGLGIRQYRRLSNAQEDNPRTGTLEGIAAGYKIPLGPFMERITHSDHSITGRLARLEEKVDQILALWQTQALPVLARLEAEAQIDEAAQPTAPPSRATGRRARAS